MAAGGKGKDARAERLAAQLRENLKRRKAKARALEARAGEGADTATVGVDAGGTGRDEGALK